MKKVLIGIVLLVATIVACLSTSATFIGEGLVGFLLLDLAALTAVAYWLPQLFAPTHPNIVFDIEVALGGLCIVGCVDFVVFAGISNVMTQRIFAWLLLSGLVLLGIGLYGRH